MDESVVPITTIKKTDLLYGYTSIHLPSFPSSIHIDFIPESSEYVGNLFPSGHLTGKWLKQTPIAGFHWHGFARVKSTLEIGNLHLWEGTHQNFSGMPSDEVSPFTRELSRFCSQYTTTWQYPHFVFFPCVLQMLTDPPLSITLLGTPWMLHIFAEWICPKWA